MNAGCCACARCVILRLFFLDMDNPPVIKETKWSKVGDEGVKWCLVSEGARKSRIDSVADLITRSTARVV